ncbi:ATP-binding protein (plasmid) [Paenibacillus sp. EC2-1]|uniref:ATP-binding protein n=1 Tax=Paenibacillus sp. EC2-1 TaxID=3388665 RepID=UPI003BEEE068
MSKSSLYIDRLREMEDQYSQRFGEYKILERQRDDEQAKLIKLMKEKEQLEMVTSLLVKTADAAREAGRKRMEKVVTKALQSVFGHDFTFEIELDEHGGKPVANFYVTTVDPTTGVMVRNEPQSSRGGGINDIIAFALQVAVLVVYNEPKIQGPVILDEPGKHVSEEYVIKFGEFLDFISKTFNRQILMITHQPHLAATADRTLVSQLISGKTSIKSYDMSTLTLSDEDEFYYEQSEDQSNDGPEERL